MHPDSLAAALDFIVKNNVDHDCLYAQLAPSNLARVQRYLRRFDSIRAKAQPVTSPKSKRSWIAQQNNLKGRCFEQVMRSLLPTVFQTWSRIQTPTNELDILVELGPKCGFFPSLREWGSHSICECKSNQDTFSVTWVDKLAGVLDKHAARVGIVMGTRAPRNKGNGRRALESIRLYAIKNRTIIILDLDDVNRCLGGANALKLIVRRYIEIRTGTEKYRLLSDG
jgi:hypothetical protein